MYEFAFPHIYFIPSPLVFCLVYFGHVGKQCVVGRPADRHTSHEASCFGGCHAATVSFLHGHLQPAIVVFYLLNWHPPVFSATQKNMTHWYIGLCKNNPGKCIFYWVHLSYKVHLSSHLYMAVPWTVMQSHKLVHRAFSAWQFSVVTSCPTVSALTCWHIRWHTLP